MDGDVMHGCSVALEQGVKVSPTVSDNEKRIHKSSLGFEVERFSEFDQGLFLLAQQTAEHQFNNNNYNLVS